MVLNLVWAGFILVGFAAALVQAAQGNGAIFGQVLAGIFDSAKSGFDIALGLVAVMCLWLGILKIGERAGLVALLARGLAPFFGRLFPQVPPGHPANGAMAMNFSANLLGLDNAATPLGLKAMQELQSLNPVKAEASNPMVMFLVLNTAGLTLIPSSVIAIRQSIAAEQGLAGFNGADILLPTLVSTFISFSAGLVAVAWVQGIRLWQGPLLAFFGGALLLVGAMVAAVAGLPPAQMAGALGTLGSALLLSVIVGFVAVGLVRRINVYEAFVDGAKDGFGVAVMIIPYLVAMLVAISVFRSTGCMDAVVAAIAAGVAAAGLNTDFVPALPVGLMKTLSGSGARALMVDVLRTHGVDSFAGRLAAIIQGSTETTFYVLALYFGSVGITRARQAVACALFADAVGLVGAIGVGYWFFH